MIDDLFFALSVGHLKVQFQNITKRDVVSASLEVGNEPPVILLLLCGNTLRYLLVT